jgi:uncharacterized protein YndB with AHSA1/START domain
MEKKPNTTITVAVSVAVPVATAWKVWTTPEDICNWNHASDDWHTTHAENDLRPGGRFLSRMEAKDGSFGFDFYGTYDRIIPEQLIEITLGDNRKVKITFTEEEGSTKLVETFEAESVNSLELQQFGWQAILDNFKKYTESTNEEWLYNL